MVISDIESREQLAFLLNIPLSKLTYLLYVKGFEGYSKKTRIFTRVAS